MQNQREAWSHAHILVFHLSVRILETNPTTYEQKMPCSATVLLKQTTFISKNNVKSIVSNNTQEKERTKKHFVRACCDFDTLTLYIQMSSKSLCNDLNFSLTSSYLELFLMSVDFFSLNANIHQTNRSFTINSFECFFQKHIRNYHNSQYI